MGYLVYARKYRPKTFKEMIGQKAVVQTLYNAIKNERVAQAYIFSGMRGVGKTTAARILAKALNCREGPTPIPCNQCDFCLEIDEDRSLDVIEIDGASHALVDDVRALQEGLQYKPVHSRYKVIIIDEVHMLGKSAFNALLKTLEEPPENTVFIFATTEFHKVPATIVSRCQCFNFKRIIHKDISEHLKYIAKEENISITSAGLNLLVEAADGSLRDAQSLLDQAVAFSGNDIKEDDLKEILATVNQELLFQFSSAVLEEKPDRIFEFVEKVIDSGYDLRYFHEQLIQHFRNLLLVSSVKDTRDILPFGDKVLEKLKNEAGKASKEEILRYLDVLQEWEQGLKYTSHPRIYLESSLIKLCHFKQIVPLKKIIEQLKEKSEGFGLRSSSRDFSQVREEQDERPKISETKQIKPKNSGTPSNKSIKKESNTDKALKDPKVQDFMDTFKAQIISVEEKKI